MSEGHESFAASQNPWAATLPVNSVIPRVLAALPGRLMSFQAIRAACVALALLFACAGCSVSRFDLPGQVGRYNDSIEEFIERAILLHVVRAANDAPLAFTQVAVIRGSGTVGSQVGPPTIRFGPAGAHSRSCWSQCVTRGPIPADLAVLNQGVLAQTLTPWAPTPGVLHSPRRAARDSPNHMQRVEVPNTTRPTPSTKSARSALRRIHDQPARLAAVRADDRYREPHGRLWTAAAGCASDEHQGSHRTGEGRIESAARREYRGCAVSNPDNRLGLRALLRSGTSQRQH